MTKNKPITEHLDCPVCIEEGKIATFTRKDYDFPETMRCCEICGADFMADTGEIILGPREVI